MKIISKYKDYYDYLMGVYGEDPLIVLDRRDFTMPTFDEDEDCKIQLFIGGYLIEGLYRDGKIYYGNSLKQFEDTEKYRGWYSWESKKKVVDYIYIDLKSRFAGSRDYDTFKIKPVLDTEKMNEKHNCPILLRKVKRGYRSVQNDIYKNCFLRKLNLNSFISATKVYQIISAWISMQRTKSENRPDNRTNVEKIKSKGFDDKTSFRPNIKD